MVRQVGPEQSVRPQYKLQKVIANAVAVVACLEASVGAWATHYIAEDTLHKPTGQELLIAQALGKVSGDKPPTVRCVTTQEMQDRADQWLDKPKRDTSTEIQGGIVPRVPFTGRTYNGLIWLLKDSCDAISAFAAQPPTNDGEMSNSELQYEVKFGLTTGAHEERHVEGMLDEAGAQCQGLQTVGKFAVALGMNPRLENSITSIAVQIQERQEHPVAGLNFGVIPPDSPYYLGNQCRPYTDFDMHIIPLRLYPNPPGGRPDTYNCPETVLCTREDG